jgi:arginine decarboxylase
MPADLETASSAHPLFGRLRAIYERAQLVSNAVEDLDEVYAGLRRLRSEMAELFRGGEVSVEEKAQFERIFWATAMAINSRLHEVDSAHLTRSLVDLQNQLLDHYQCNFSIFRSMVDHWAIGQRFPIMPIHRLSEPPSRRGMLVDLTCDSDGKVRTFVSPEGDKRFLELHDLRPNEPYYLGVFLMGAYQDIMGDMHNLFGRVTEAHVYVDEDEPGNFYLEEILPGTTVEEQLETVQYYANDLERRMGDLIQKEVKGGRVRPKEGVKLLNEYRRVFRNMTYLNTDMES